MRKSISSSSTDRASVSRSSQWFDLEELASVEISSEDAQHPFEEALKEGSEIGWKAASSGPQTIRLSFDSPQRIRRIRLEFFEEEAERSQEFALSAISANRGRKEIVRQQWTFSPGGSNTEVEDYTVDLAEVTSLELQIDPGRHEKHRMASLRFFALA